MLHFIFATVFEWSPSIRFLGALKYLHGLGICHCDIKPDNFLFLTDSVPDSTLKLIDFGNSKFLSDKNFTDKVRYFSHPTYCCISGARNQSLISLTLHVRGQFISSFVSSLIYIA